MLLFKNYLLFLCCFLISTLVFSQTVNHQDKFKQLYEELPTPNVYRTASGAPGHEYYQQQADYNMQITLDEKNQRIYGQQQVIYTNNSPDQLTYLWVQLDQNMRAKDSNTKKIQTGTINTKMSFYELNKLHQDFDGGFKIEFVKDPSGNNLPYVINQTMMRIDLPQPLKTGKQFQFNIKWWYNINDREKIGGRSGMEYFKDEDNYLFTIAQFFPRMAVYNEVEGWQNKQFLGRGEFTLPFGNYVVALTVPEDHVVASTGTLQNPNDVLSETQQKRLKEASNNFEKPVFIVTQDEAKKAEKSKKTGTKTWIFKAENVRDFAFASSRKFIWDAMAVKIGQNNILAMSFYPKEGNPLWEQYSTKVVAHTLKVYSKYTINYPYPVAISVHTNKIGMEYPMICFNGGRPEADGTYSERTKYGMIGVIIHEVGHNFFPMIINSDERQWTWMDEGLNTFVQYLTEQEWDRDYPSRRGPAHKIVDYMKGDKSMISPIMTNSEAILQFGNNAYGKPATALNILRETVMGRELFDYAFKTYCERWAFKHPTPADFFRTMEDASAVDLDWFWHGWFYTTQHVDISIEQVNHFKINTQNPEIELPLQKQEALAVKQHIGYIKNQTDIAKTVVEHDPETKDFYNNYDPFKPTKFHEEDYKKYLKNLTDEEIKLLNANINYYQINFKNIGGLVMPLVIEFTFDDKTTQVIRIPAEIWQRNNDEVSKVFFFNKQVESVTLDPFFELADPDVYNNHWPRKVIPTRFELYKQENYPSDNPMKKSKKN